MYRLKSTRAAAYEYMPREAARSDETDEMVNAQWVRISRGSSDHPDVRHHLVVQERRVGGRLDELFAVTPALTIVDLLL